MKVMLCHDFEVDGSVLKENGLDGDKVTAAYRKAVAEGLRNLMVRGFVAERKRRDCGVLRGYNLL